VRRALAIAILLALAATAHADPLDDAHALESSLQYDKALALVDAAIASGHALDLAKLHFEAGKLAAGLERAVDAEQHFAIALELEPALALPEGSSPKLTAPYYAARARTKPFAVAHARVGSVLTVKVTDSAQLARAVRIHYVGSRGPVYYAFDHAPYDFEVPADAPDIELVIVDEHGNLVYKAVDPQPRPKPEAGPEAPPPVTGGGWPRGTPWLVAGGMAAVSGALCFWRFQVAQDEWNTLNDDTTPHDYSQLRAIENRGRDWAWAANASFIAAGALALVGGFFTYTAHANGMVVAATPTSLGVAGRF